MPTDLVALENLFLGLADKTRLRLLGLMAAGPVSVGHLVSETGESQPKISRHLAYLRNAGLVETTRDGKWIYYGVAGLANASADSVFHCVIAEISGRGAAPRQHTRHEQQRSPAPEPESIEPLYTGPDETDDRDSTEIDRIDHAREPRQELEIFLL